ncbi:hypothetical protein NQ129_04730 [Priestia aryabhattai]|uniref:hypothetical protein n=1 Tax=Priestia aryabhattai TaxID=412384 RepID=UPI00211BBE2C|nr:hypothetical protein [Priestia aryabhattai]MCQ9281073.1 hypothetical protein [Priestia aryabhattai]
MYHKEMRINIKGFLFRTIILLMLINLILPAITGSWIKVGTYSIAYTYIFNYSTITSVCSYIAIFLIYILLALCIYNNKKRGRINLIVALSTLVFTIWSVISIFEASAQEVLLGDISTNLSLIPLFYLLGYEKRIFEEAKKIVPYVVVIMIGLILWTSMLFILHNGITAETRSSPSKEMFSIAISAYWCYSLAMPSSKKYNKVFKYTIGMCLLICAFLIRSRSWVIQCILVLYTTLALTPGKRGLFRKIISIFIVILVIVLIVNLFPNITGALFSRIGEDTRSGQYDAFFSQIELINLIWGQGINASYSFLGNPNYKYFDNQYLYIMFHYGAIPILCVLGIISGLFRKMHKSNLTKDEVAFIVGCRLISIFFLAALGGLSVYYKLGWNVGTILTFVFIGRAHKIIKDSREIKLVKKD